MIFNICFIVKKSKTIEIIDSKIPLAKKLGIQNEGEVTQKPVNLQLGTLMPSRLSNFHFLIIFLGANR